MIRKMRKVVAYLLLAATLAGTAYFYTRTPIPKDAVEQYIDLLSAPEWGVRGRAALALGRLGDPRAHEPLIECLRTGDAPMRDAVCDALTALGPTAIPSLLACLDDTDPSIRERSMAILARIGDHKVVEPLLAYLERQCTMEDIVRDPGYSRMAAVRALGILGDVRAIRPLIEFLSINGQKVEIAAKALAQIGRPALMPLIGALTHGSGQTRNGAARALAHLGEPALAALFERLDDGDTDTRKSVVEALGFFDASRVIEPLILRLRDSSSGVRGRAAEVLGRLADMRAVDPLIASLSDEDDYVRRAVVRALAQVGSEKAMLHVTKSLNDPDWSVRETARKALAQSEETSSDGE